MPTAKLAASLLVLLTLVLTVAAGQSHDGVWAGRMSCDKMSTTKGPLKGAPRR